MNYKSAIQHCKSLLRGDRQTWRHLPYQLRMKMCGVDVRWMSLQESGLSEERCHRYSDSGGPDLEDLLDTLTILTSDSALDIGCGKGGALISLAKYGFARVDGVEISAELAEVARNNMRRLRINNSAIYCSDAAEFTDLDRYNFFYAYNPFPRTVTRRVLENIQSSLRRRERRAMFVYKNPEFHSYVLEAGFRKIAETRQVHPDYPPFFVYATEAAETARPQELHAHA
jgi:SAM-dependent methyltransferase